MKDSLMIIVRLVFMSLLKSIYFLVIIYNSWNVVRMDHLILRFLFYQSILESN